MAPRVLRRGGAVIAIAAIIALGTAPGAHSDTPVALDGLFALAPGTCDNGSVTGSFFRMILPAGDSNGPFLSNSDSGCSDQTVTPLSAGSDGGLVSGTYQPQPEQAFDGAGNAVSGSVTRPVRFYGVGFATATNPTDPQTGSATEVPRLFADGTTLSGDLSSLGVTWNNQVFNQGAPKPGGSLPGKTRALSGTIDPATGTYVIEWTSQIVGGPFNNFTGLWHLTGQYRGGGDPSAGAPAPANPPAPGAGGVPAASAPGAPAAPAAPVAPGAPAPLATAPAAGQPAAPADPALATRTVDLPGSERAPRWVVPALLLLALLGVAAFVNADRLAGRKKP